MFRMSACDQCNLSQIARKRLIGLPFDSNFPMPIPGSIASTLAKLLRLRCPLGPPVTLGNSTGSGDTAWMCMFT